jgi:hypothetical protein
MRSSGQSGIGFTRKAGSIRLVSGVLVWCMLLYIAPVCDALAASPRQIEEYRWEGVERIVAIGDIHGDYNNYLATLQAAGVADARGRWIAGQTHLVQTGDIPDRGPDTRKIIAHMQQLARQARRQGGRVHNLMGNHEAMNVYGDLRYVSPGEYQAFVTRDSASLRDRYFAKVLARLESNASNAVENSAPVPANFRSQWEKSHPLGWVEHRLAWDPAWNPRAEYFRWVMELPLAIQINDLIFVHGGISGAYCQNSLESLTRMAREALRRKGANSPRILTDEHGPLWYRGLSGVKPEAAAETVTAILRKHAAHHIVVGHTRTDGVIWPRYDGRVIQIDTGLSAAYGGHPGYLEVTPDGLFAGYRPGKIKLPQDDAGRGSYLEQVIALQGEHAALQARLAALKALPADTAQVRADNAPNLNHAGPAAEAQAMPICGISP